MKEASYYYKKIPRSRIATFDTYEIGLHKHHVAALLEFDVTESRTKLKESKKRGKSVSFNAWIIKVIGSVLQTHPEATAFLFSKRKLIIFRDINVSILVEKELDNEKVPIAMVIGKVNEKSVAEITAEIENAKNRELSEKDFPPRLEFAVGSKPYPAGGTYRDERREGHLVVRAVIMLDKDRELASKIARVIGEITGLRVIAKNWPQSRSLVRYEFRPKYRDRSTSSEAA